MAPTQTAVEVVRYSRDHEAALRVTDSKPVPAPKEGQALVRVRARPINPSDFFCIEGRYGGFRPASLPATPGLEGYGTIEDIGPGPHSYKSRTFRIGQRVVGVPWPSEKGEGTWQQYVAVPLKDLLPVADEVSDEDAAQYLINPVTALGFLEDLKVPPGQYLLQNAANSILGQELVAICKRRGTRLINVVRRREAMEMLKAKGAEEVICSADEDIVERTHQITGGVGAWAAINPVGGPASKPFFQAVRNSGLVYIYSLFGDEVIVPMWDLHFRDITVRGFWLTKWLASLTDEEREQKLQEVMQLMAQGVIKPPPPSAKYPLEDVKEAIKMAEQKSGKDGKVLLVG